MGQENVYYNDVGTRHFFVLGILMPPQLLDFFSVEYVSVLGKFQNFIILH
jgi:hypothetical protein